MIVSEPSRVVVVFNPAARSRDSDARKEETKNALDNRRLEYTWLETTADDPGTEMLRSALDDDVDLVLASGGDGTVMACATALANKGIPLALLPAGTGNLLANNLNLPRDLPGALEVAMSGATRTIDVGSTPHGCFVIMAGMGFDAAMLRDADPKLKSRLGAVAYVRSGLKHVRAPAHHVKLLIDDEQHLDCEAHMILIANIGKLQGGLTAVPSANPEDGLLTVAVIEAGSVSAWVKLLWRLVRGNRADDARVRTIEARKLEITSDPAMPVELDGDVFEEARSFSVEVLPSALKLRVPPDLERAVS
jgi:YegS/Rv2252/BmrU family lipid kinase